MTDTQSKAIRLIEEELEAIGFELEANLRQIAGATERRVELEQRRKSMLLLLKMSGGTPAAYRPEAVSA